MDLALIELPLGCNKQCTRERIQRPETKACWDDLEFSVRSGAARLFILAGRTSWFDG